MGNGLVWFPFASVTVSSLSLHSSLLQMDISQIQTKLNLVCLTMISFLLNKLIDLKAVWCLFTMWPSVLFLISSQMRFLRPFLLFWGFHSFEMCRPFPPGVRTLAFETAMFFFWPCHRAFRILVPNQGWDPGLWQWEHGVLTTGPPGKSQQPYSFISLQPTPNYSLMLI